ncbi:membrane-associated proteins in eicosanoid and glutathione metabolism [Xylariaceae sp. FL1272]|nr:membrane-associated proteins in eicosanoid and glutathione metabolism [Xylariaceae sp. FL1272]
MTFTLQLPTEYPYVIAVATSTIFVNSLHKVLTSAARKASGIKYPTPYATQEQADKDPKAYKFNLAQRAHGNFGENYTSFIIPLLVSGLRYPTLSYWSGAAWVVGRLAYAYAYTNYGPNGRLPGYVAAQLAKTILTVSAVLTCWHMIQDM